MEFQPIAKDTIRSLVSYMSGHNGRLCDFTPINLYIWKDYFYKAYAIEDDMLFLQLCGEHGETCYAVPMGAGDAVAALKRLKAHTDQVGEPLRLSLVSKEMLPAVREAFGDVNAVSDREWCDYLYDAKRMAAFEGSAYAKQRNHVRRFERAYPDHRVEWLSPSHRTVIEAFLDEFARLRNKEDDLAFEEIARTKKALAAMKTLSLFGVVLYVGEELVGFSAGTRVDDTLFVNFEKADTAYDGVYQKLVKSFASAFADDTVCFINREEDCGDEGLRKSKLAYHPIELLEKYNIEII